MTVELIRANKDGDLSFVYVWKNDSAKDEFAGRHVKCPACKQPLGIPRPQVKEESYQGHVGLGRTWRRRSLRTACSTSKDEQISEVEISEEQMQVGIIR
jgi:hypothetical protein